MWTVNTPNLFEASFSNVLNFSSDVLLLTFKTAVRGMMGFAGNKRDSILFLGVYKQLTIE